MGKKPSYIELEQRIKALEKDRYTSIPYQTILENISDTVIVCNEQGEMIYVCPNTINIFGLTQDEIYSLVTIEKLMNGKICEISDLEAKDELRDINWTIQNSSGETRYLLINAKPIEKIPNRVLYVMHDITDRKLAELSLKKSEEQYRTILETISDGVILKAATGEFLTWNKGAEQILGISADDIIGRNLEDKVWATIREDGSEYKVQEYPSVKTLQNGVSCKNEIMGIYKNSGELQWVSINTNPVYENNKTEPSAVAISFSEVTELKKKKLELAELNETLKKAQHFAKIGSWWFDPVTQIPTWTEEMFHILGLEPESQALLCNEHKKIIHPDDWEHFESSVDRALNDGVGYDLELRITRPSGEMRFVNSRCEAELDELGSVKRLIGTTQDITEKKIAEEELRHAVKMQAIGVLAGGVAHEFNNILAIILGNAELLQMSVSRKEAKMAKAISEASNRGKNLVKQILDFSRKDDENFKTVDLKEQINNVVGMLVQVLPRSIAIHKEIPNNLELVHANAGQVEQVLTNLALNAKDAMPNGGALTISAENAMEEDLPDQLKAVGSRFVKVSVMDNGFGINQDIIDQVFDPFFTTKPVGKGTGLGLSVVYGIVERHKGHISCKSSPNTGTIFTLLLPVTDEEVLLDNQAEEQVLLLEEKITILAVDDEADFLDILKMHLKTSGFQSICVKSGIDALKVYKEKRNQIDIILLDIGMPVMDGHECLQKLIEFDPNVKVIITSGYSEKGNIKNTLDMGATDYLVKPYDKKHLSKVIQKVLDQESG